MNETEEELRKILLTSDGKGAKEKARALEELLDRVSTESFENGVSAGLATTFEV